MVSVAAVPRVRCPDHGAITVRVPWAEPFRRFTRLFERRAIQVLRECPVSGACQGLRISWEEADGIRQRAVKRGLARKAIRPLRYLGVDEKCAGRGQNYVTVVARREPGRPATVEHVGDGRTQATRDGFWEQVPAEVRALGAQLGHAIRKVLTRLPRLAPSLAGQAVEVIAQRLREHETEVLAQLPVVEDRLRAWHDASTCNADELPFAILACRW
jgi:hypothetical protein